MARTFDQILAEVNATSDPQRNTILNQVADIPRQTAAEEAGLQATQTQAFDEILGGARRRGLGYSGIPVGEQAQYTATQFLPAVARLKTAANERKTTLESALNDIGRTNYMSAQDIFARDRAFEEDQRRFELQQQEAARSRAAAAQASATPSWMQALLGSNAAAQAQPAVDPEEAAYQAYLKQQAAQEQKYVSKLSANKGLNVLNPGTGLRVQGAGTIPTGNVTFKKKLGK